MNIKVVFRGLSSFFSIVASGTEVLYRQSHESTDEGLIDSPSSSVSVLSSIEKCNNLLDLNVRMLSKFQTNILLPIFLVLISILLAACNTGNELEKLGLEKTVAEDFYNFSNTTKELYSTLIKINEYLPDKKFVVTNEDYKEVSSLVKDLETYYESLNPKGFSEFQEYLYNESNTIRSPILIIDNIEKNSRQFKIAEAMLMFDNLTYYAKTSLEANNVSDDNVDIIMDWYHNNNDYQNLFQEAYEHRFDK
ncbi:hypothetical protein [Enterococcus casseliflavus]|uniref:hypothetical protein n=1 Tax=Enterococcus casseliflavus TaxID=37734 RepID=UPI001CA8AC85|nr:hypothetical protein [Enterococcus casseliflavus]MBZ0323653.1 hypothetical protein [Enterococcus casseliflavus]